MIRLETDGSWEGMCTHDHHGPGSQAGRGNQEKKEEERLQRQQQGPQEKWEEQHPVPQAARRQVRL